MRWIEKRCEDMHPEKGLQIMYGIDGRADLPEIELNNLDGYRGSRPVRIGNAASGQLQLDIYGELMDSVYLYDKYGRPIDYDGWQDITKLIDFVCKNHHRKDAGIWEVRGGKKEYLYSKLMCWVAVDRALRLAGKRSFPTPPALWFKNARHPLQANLHEVLGPEKRGVHPGARQTRSGCFVADDAAGAFPQSDRPPLAVVVARHQGKPRGGYAGVSLQGQRWVRRRGGSVHDVFLLVRGMPGAAAAIWNRPATSSRKCSATRTISACTRRNSDPAAST